MKKTANYVDGFILPIRKNKVKDYVKMAKLAGKIWLEYGAIDYFECIADDVKPGKYTSFPQSVKLKKGEVVFFSWATYKSRAHRDAVMKKIMKDDRINAMGDTMMKVMDGKRMFWGGFKPLVRMQKGR
jgi:uncharacterized protein YbaA (DUF1428 family)